eukprot:scaffold89957_cov13-Tisochrysis_lutea.AAC.1
MLLQLYHSLSRDAVHLVASTSVCTLVSLLPVSTLAALIEQGKHKGGRGKGQHASIPGNVYLMPGSEQPHSEASSMQGLPSSRELWP